MLVRDISQRVDAVAVDRDAGRWTAEGGCRLRVEFDKFHAAGDSQVVTTGRYWIHAGNHTRVIKKEFDIVRTLSADGYAAAVRQLRASLETLATQIVAHMSATAACSPSTQVGT